MENRKNDYMWLGENTDLEGYIGFLDNSFEREMFGLRLHRKLGDKK